jgi:hypothetical protein
MIEYIYDSVGDNIAFFINGQLWNLDGNHVGRFLVKEGIFINLAGHYIGEMHNGRLVNNTNSPYRKVPFGQQSDLRHIGKYVPMVSQIGIMLPMGYAAFDRNHLKR